MCPIIENDNGSIVITNEVIARIAGAMALECYGIVGMASRRAIDGIVELLGMDNLTRGIEISSDDDGIHLDMYIIVQYGISLEQSCKSIRDTVHYSLEQMTGLHIANVNVHVEGIQI